MDMERTGPVDLKSDDSLLQGGIGTGPGVIHVDNFLKSGQRSGPNNLGVPDMPQRIGIKVSCCVDERVRITVRDFMLSIIHDNITLDKFKSSLHDQDILFVDIPARCVGKLFSKPERSCDFHGIRITWMKLEPAVDENDLDQAAYIVLNRSHDHDVEVVSSLHRFFKLHRIFVDTTYVKATKRLVLNLEQSVYGFLTAQLGWGRDKSVELDCGNGKKIQLYPLPPVDWVPLVDGDPELNVIQVCRLPRNKDQLKSYFERACVGLHVTVKNVCIQSDDRALVFLENVHQVADVADAVLSDIVYNELRKFVYQEHFEGVMISIRRVPLSLSIRVQYDDTAAAAAAADDDGDASDDDASDDGQDGQPGVRVQTVGPRDKLSSKLDALKVHFKARLVETREEYALPYPGVVDKTVKERVFDMTVEELPNDNVLVTFPERNDVVAVLNNPASKKLFEHDTLKIELYYKVDY